MTPTCVWPACQKKPAADLPICATHRDEVLKVTRDKARAKRTTGNGRKHVVYYLRVGDLIKIGYTFKLEQRLRQYPPDAVLLAVEPGDEELEKQRHHHLRHSLARGREWFHPTPEVEEFVQHVITQNGPPVVIKERSSRRSSGPQVHYPVTVRYVDPRRDT